MEGNENNMSSNALDETTGPLNDDAAEVLARARLRHAARSNQQPRQVQESLPFDQHRAETELKFKADALMKRTFEERLSIQAPPAPPVWPKNEQLHYSLL